MLPDAVYNCALCTWPDCWICRDGRWKYLKNFVVWEKVARESIGG